jgi:hypothetical protein
MKPAKIPTDPLMVAWYSLPGFVYFLKAGSAVKIGVAAQTKGKSLQDAVKRRMTQIQSANHEPIELLGIIYFPAKEGDMPTLQAENRERELHEKFSSLLRFKRYTVGAEWLNLSDELRTYISNETTKPKTLQLSESIASLP